MSKGVRESMNGYAVDSSLGMSTVVNRRTPSRMGTRNSNFV